MAQKYITSLNSVINEIKSKTQLDFPRTGKPYYIYTESSELAAGAVIKQDHSLVAFWSNKWSKTERSLTVVEKETLAFGKAITL